MFAQLARDERNCLPYDAALLQSVVFPGRPFVGQKEIANARDHLVALGVFLHKATHRREWLEIAPEYRNNDGENETSFGEAEKRPEQVELSFGPQLVHNPQPVEKRRDKKKSRVVVVSSPPASGTQDDNNHNDVAELEREASARGVDLNGEERRWRERSQKEGWSETDEGWRRWLAVAMESKPRPRIESTPPAAPARSVPPEWEAFVKECFPLNNDVPAVSYAKARGNPEILEKFKTWRKAA